MKKTVIIQPCTAQPGKVNVMAHLDSPLTAHELERLEKMQGVSGFSKELDLGMARFKKKGVEVTVFLSGKVVLRKADDEKQANQITEEIEKFLAK